ncbi:hypothetical protein T03_10751 [Trichinella britovi]|uniref:Uncharacterized protein n=1 Tax=Trichinella britovi TaxID=45882 RepID=A0A0V1C9B6_TRIBR|nr:hypothetical protein T03_10751 [Trichinella britovi]
MVEKSAPNMATPTSATKNVQAKAGRSANCTVMVFLPRWLTGVPLIACSIGLLDAGCAGCFCDPVAGSKLTAAPVSIKNRHLDILSIMYKQRLEVSGDTTAVSVGGVHFWARHRNGGDRSTLVVADLGCSVMECAGLIRLGITSGVDESSVSDCFLDGGGHLLAGRGIRSKRLSNLPLSELTALIAVVGWSAAIWSVSSARSINGRSWKGRRAVRMGRGSFLRNNDLTMSSEAPPRRRCNRRKNCDGLSSLSSSFVSACRMRWSFVCNVRFRPGCLKVVNGSEIRDRFVRHHGEHHVKFVKFDKDVLVLKKLIEAQEPQFSVDRVEVWDCQVVETALLEGCPASFMLRRDGIMVGITHGSPNVVDDGDSK